jgi:hypothetical protein
MFVLDKLLVRGLRFVLGTVATAADAEGLDGETLKRDLLDAQMRLELGEIDEGEYEAIERSVLDALKEQRANRGELNAVFGRVRAADVVVEGPDIETVDRRSPPKRRRSRRRGSR